MVSLYYHDTIILLVCRSTVVAKLLGFDFLGLIIFIRIFFRNKQEVGTPYNIRPNFVC